MFTYKHRKENKIVKKIIFFQFLYIYNNLAYRISPKPTGKLNLFISMKHPVFHLQTAKINLQLNKLLNLLIYVLQRQ